MKLVSPQRKTIFGPITWSKYLLLQHNEFKITKFRLFVTECLCHRKAELSEFEPIILRKEKGRIKKCPAQPHVIIF